MFAKQENPMKNKPEIATYQTNRNLACTYFEKCIMPRQTTMCLAKDAVAYPRLWLLMEQFGQTLEKTLPYYVAAINQ